MSDPYRDELSPLRAQLSALQAEASDIDKNLGRAEAMHRRRAAIDAEVAELEQRLRNLEAQSTLDGLRIASPCTADWSQMVGDDRVRFCGQCSKSVYNVSGMSRDEAHALLRENSGGPVCMRIYRRADGTVMTNDCPVGEKKKRVRRLAMVAGGVAMTAMAGAFLAMRGSGTMGQIPVAGDVRVPDVHPTADTRSMMMGAVAPMGTVAVPSVDPPTPPTNQPKSSTPHRK